MVKFLDDNPAIAAIEDVAASAPKADYETWGKVRRAVEGRYRSRCCAVCGALLFCVSCIAASRMATAACGWLPARAAQISRWPLTLFIRLDSGSDEDPGVAVLGSSLYNDDPDLFRAVSGTPSPPPFSSPVVEWPLNFGH